MIEEKLSQLISRRLNELNITKAELAKRASLSRAYIGDLANGTAKTTSGQYSPNPEIVNKLSQALSIETEEILKTIGYDIQLKTLPPQLADLPFDQLNERDLEIVKQLITTLIATKTIVK